jgi:hypothetical protein
LDFVLVLTMTMSVRKEQKLVVDMLEDLFVMMMMMLNFDLYESMMFS